MSKFKEYYDNPEYRKKHNDYLLQKIECKCGCSVLRSNLTKHKNQSKIHKKWIEDNTDNMYHYKKKLVAIKKQTKKIEPDINNLINVGKDFEIITNKLNNLIKKLK